MKIFVSGIHASGKTTLAKLIAEEKKIKYIDFDDLWNYNDNFSVQCESLFNGILMEDDYVIDAIPYCSNIELPIKKFINFCSKNKDAFVLFVFCSNFDKWLDRLEIKAETREEYLRNHFNMYRTYVERIKERILLFYDSIDSRYVHYSEFKKLTSWLDEQ